MSHEVLEICSAVPRSIGSYDDAITSRLGRHQRDGPYEIALVYAGPKRSASSLTRPRRHAHSVAAVRTSRDASILALNL